MQPIKCFYLEETNKLQRYLRRYHDDCKAPYRWLNGMTAFDIVEHPANTTISLDLKPDNLVPHDDQRWPQRCDCGHVFVEGDHRQISIERIYRRTDTGEEMILRGLPAGAMWDAWWYPAYWKGADGRALVGVCPDGHEWLIDGVASNCTLPNDREHRCWVRHGEPPNITVDKNGKTCAAGAGSIQTKNWHGFLRNGYLVDC